MRCRHHHEPNAQETATNSPWDHELARPCDAEASHRSCGERPSSSQVGWVGTSPTRTWIGSRIVLPQLPLLLPSAVGCGTTPEHPKFTLLLRTDSKTRTNLSRTLSSLRRQTYDHWSSVVFRAQADASAASFFRKLVRNAISWESCAGDTLSPEALYEFARAIVDGDPRPDVLYCDEDHLGRDGRTRCRPNFKPSWSPEMLLSYHYTGRLRRSCALHAGGRGSWTGPIAWRGGRMGPDAAPLGANRSDRPHPPLPLPQRQRDLFRRRCSWPNDIGITPRENRYP